MRRAAWSSLVTASLGLRGFKTVSIVNSKNPVVFTAPHCLACGGGRRDSHLNSRSDINKIIWGHRVNNLKEGKLSWFAEGFPTYCLRLPLVVWSPRARQYGPPLLSPLSLLVRFWLHQHSLRRPSFRARSVIQARLVAPTNLRTSASHSKQMVTS